MMTHGGMLYAAALYNNGVLPGKDPLVGESYAPDGKPRGCSRPSPPPATEEMRDKGVVPALVPFPRWELGQTGNPFRVFERGGRRKLEVGLPDPFEDPGKPDKGLSPRGPGTLNRTDPVVLGAQKTRLLDPMLSLLGTNDHPGDYRSSGCSACHVVYANDRSKANSGPYADVRKPGSSASRRIRTIPKDEPGHPLKHVFTRAIPSSQCMTCHMHPGHEHGDHLPRLHLVGQRGGRPGDVPEGAEEADRGPAGRDRAGEPRGLRPAGPLVRPRTSSPTSPPSTRSSRTRSSRTSTATAGSSARSSSKRPEGQPARRGRASRCPTERPRQVQEGGPPEGHPPREGDALRGLPLQAGQPRQRQALRRAAGGRRDRLHRLPRHDQPARRPS